MSKQVQKRRRKAERVRIRKCSFTEELYLDRQGNWVEYERAAVFSNQDAAERFAAKHKLGSYFGLF